MVDINQHVLLFVFLKKTLKLKDLSFRQIVRLWNMQKIYVLYLINMNICTGNWLISGRNPRMLALKLIPERLRKYGLI